MVHESYNKLSTNGVLIIDVAQSGLVCTGSTKDPPGNNLLSIDPMTQCRGPQNKCLLYKVQSIRECRRWRGPEYYLRLYYLPPPLGCLLFI